MLKGISPVLPPELLSILCEMGHGDTLVIADGNFPAASIAKDCKLVRCDGHGVPEILKAILKLVPLDQYVEKPVTLMDVVPGDDCETPIWDTYKQLVSEVDDRGADVIGTIDRFPFYDEAKKAYVVIATSERAQYTRTSRSTSFVRIAHGTGPLAAGPMLRQRETNGGQPGAGRPQKARKSCSRASSARPSPLRTTRAKSTTTSGASTSTTLPTPA